jgi:hypothetical protein
MRSTRTLNTMIPNDLHDRLLNAAVALDAYPSGIITVALRRELGRLERRNGGPFPPRGSKRVRVGRPRARRPVARRAE